MSSNWWMYVSLDNISIPSECIISIDIMPISNNNLQIHYDLFKNGQGFGGGWSLHYSENSIFASFNDTYSTDGKQSNTYTYVTPKYNEWCHLSIKFKNNQSIIYLDDYSTGPYACNIENNSKVHIGGHVDGTFKFKNLKITSA